MSYLCLGFLYIGDDKWLTTGSGDGVTRWMLWDDLKKMPNVCYKIKYYETH